MIITRWCFGTISWQVRRGLHLDQCCRRSLVCARGVKLEYRPINGYGRGYQFRRREQDLRPGVAGHLRQLRGILGRHRGKTVHRCGVKRRHQDVSLSVVKRADQVLLRAGVAFRIDGLRRVRRRFRQRRVQSERVLGANHLVPWTFTAGRQRPADTTGMSARNG